MSHDHFEAIYRAHYARVWRYFRVNSISDDESPLLATIAKTILLNRVRARQTQKRNARMVEIDDPDLIFAEPPAPEELDYADRKAEEARQMRLRAAIESLPPGQRECLRLRMQGLTYEEIAKTLGISLDAVKSRLRDATRTLREQLGEKS
jgi:RNA polymerase sigma factor (sigma-70 family)